MLVYHACAEREDAFIGGLSINTTPARLAAQLDFLARHYRMITVEAIGGDAAGVPSAAITFDDGFRSVHRVAMPMLADRGVPATCYLVTDRLADRRPIWINELNWYLERHGDAALALVAERIGLDGRCAKSRIIRTLIDRYESGAIDGIEVELRSKFGPADAAERLHLDRDEIVQMSERGLRFGNHTATHAVLSRLDDEACRAEIAAARTAITGLPGAMDSLAFPFGLASTAAAAIARELGYRSLMGVDGVDVPPGVDAIPRISVGDDTPAVLFARMELVLAVAVSARADEASDRPGDPWFGVVTDGTGRRRPRHWPCDRTGVG